MPVLVRRKIRITWTQERTLTVRGAEARSSEWCARCGAFVAMLTPEEAAAVAGVKTRDIFRWLESERVHFVETANLSPLVCLASLPATVVHGGAGDFDTDAATEATAALLKLEQGWSKEGEAR